jgi:hypothetical protein
VIAAPTNSPALYSLTFAQSASEAARSAGVSSPRLKDRAMKAKLAAGYCIFGKFTGSSRFPGCPLKTGFYLREFWCAILGLNQLEHRS